jgi:hypothetical protein
MISDPALYRRRNRLLPTAFVISLALHVLGITAYTLFARHLPWINPTHEKEPIIVLSSATTISHLTVPYVSRPLSRGMRGSRSSRPDLRIAQQQPERQQQPQRRQRPRLLAVAPPPAYRELTVPASKATPMPSPEPSRPAVRQAPQPQSQASRETPQQRFAQMLAREQSAYRREIAQLQEQNNPLSAATMSPRPPSAFRRSYINISGLQMTNPVTEAIATPVRRWTEDGLNCYYAHIDVAYSDGAGEDETLPWALCYPPDRDVLGSAADGALIPVRYFAPMRGFELPPGTTLTPVEQFLYNEPRQ